MSAIEDLASVSQNLADDLNVSDDGNYADPTPPAPVPEGNYRLRLEIALDKDQAGNIKGQTDERGRFYPTILIKKGEVVEGPAGTEGRTALSSTRVYTRPFDRGNGQANGLADLTRSFDQTRGFNSFADGFALLEELAATGTMRCRLTWEGFDKDHWDASLAALGKTASDLTKEEKKALNTACTIKGAKKFDKNGIATGPSGATVSARARLATTYPSSEKVKI